MDVLYICLFFYLPECNIDNIQSKFHSRDVKTVYFSKPVTGLPKPVFYRLPVTERPIVS